MMILIFAKYASLAMGRIQKSVNHVINLSIMNTAIFVIPVKIAKLVIMGIGLTVIAFLNAQLDYIQLLDLKPSEVISLLHHAQG